MRLIDADKLVKTPIDTTDIPINKCLDVVLLEDLETAPTVGEWIPVSERLPEKDGSYLVCMSWHYQKMDVLTWADGWNCARNLNGKVNRKSEIPGAYILAWMPLPEPYRAESEDKE